MQTPRARLLKWEVGMKPAFLWTPVATLQSESTDLFSNRFLERKNARGSQVIEPTFTEYPYEGKYWDLMSYKISLFSQRIIFFS